MTQRTDVALDLIAAVDRIAPLYQAWATAGRVAGAACDRLALRRRRLAGNAWHDAQCRVMAEFASARGWRVASHDFTPEMLRTGRPGRNAQRDYCNPPRDNLAYDHPYFFRHPTRPYRPAGIVVHVYATDYARCLALAAEEGLDFEPLPASWYYPGVCLAGVYTRRA